MAATRCRRSRWVGVVATVVLVVGGCADDRSTEPAPPSAAAEGTAATEDSPARDGAAEAPSATTGEGLTEVGGAADTSGTVSFDEIRDLCSYVSVEEIASIVQVEVRAGVPDEDAFDGVRYRACSWDIGPEFEPSDNSDVTVSVNDRPFADDPLGGPADTTIAGRAARQPADYEVYLDMDGWTMGLSVYAGHNAAGQADPTFSSQSLHELATLLLDRIEGP